MWEGDLEGLGGVSEVPHGQAAVRVAAHELLAFVMPAHWVDGLQAHSAKENCMNTALKTHIKNKITVFLPANGTNLKPSSLEFIWSSSEFVWLLLLQMWKLTVYELLIFMKCMKYNSLFHFPPTPDWVDEIKVFHCWIVTMQCQCHILDIKTKKGFIVLFCFVFLSDEFILDPKFRFLTTTSKTSRYNQPSTPVLQRNMFKNKRRLICYSAS